MTLAAAFCGLYLLAGAMFAVGVYNACHKPEKWRWGSRWRACVFYAVMVSAWAPIVLFPSFQFIVACLRGRRRVESHRL